MPGMRIFHIATLADWKDAQTTGTYTMSTFGRTLDRRATSTPPATTRCRRA